jgi:hypothetical protein
MSVAGRRADRIQYHPVASFSSRLLICYRGRIQGAERYRLSRHYSFVHCGCDADYFQRCSFRWTRGSAHRVIGLTMLVLEALFGGRSYRLVRVRQRYGGRSNVPVGLVPLVIAEVFSHLLLTLAIRRGARHWHLGARQSQDALKKLLRKRTGGPIPRAFCLLGATRQFG